MLHAAAGRAGAAAGVARHAFCTFTADSAATSPSFIGIRSPQPSLPSSARWPAPARPPARPPALTLPPPPTVCCRAMGHRAIGSRANRAAGNLTCRAVRRTCRFPTTRAMARLRTCLTTEGAATVRTKAALAPTLGCSRQSLRTHRPRLTHVSRVPSLGIQSVSHQTRETCRHHLRRNGPTSTSTCTET